MRDYTIVKLDKSNIHWLYTLYNAVYKKPRQSPFYEKKYDTAYTGVEDIGFFAIKDNEVIGFVGCIPTFISIGNKQILAAQLLDVMVVERHRQKGIFVELGIKVIQQSKSQNIDLLFTFPNQYSSQTILKKLEFYQLHIMNTYTFNYSNNWIKKVGMRLLTVNKPKSVLAIDNALLAKGYDGVIYDLQYLQYKRYNPNAIYMKELSKIWFRTKGNAWLGAIDFESGEDFETALTYAIKQKPWSSLTYMVSPNNPTDDLFQKIVSPHAGFQVCVKDLTGLLDLSNLRFQFADIDVF